jgi:hypothetical protein
LQNSSGSKKKWFGKKKLHTSDSYQETDQAPPCPPPEEDIILTHVENENNHDHVQVVTDVDVEVPVPDVQIQIAEVQATPIVQFTRKPPTDEVAAIKIQTAFRRYMVFIFQLLSTLTVPFRSSFFSLPLITVVLKVESFR